MRWDTFLVVYVVIGALALMASWLCLRMLKDRQLAWAMVSVKGVLVGEQAYYGIGRLWPETYATLSWYWPGVMSLKLGYCVALAAVVWTLVTHDERMK